MKRKMLAACLALSLLAGCTGSSVRQVQPADDPDPVASYWSPDSALAVADFGAALLRESGTEGENCLVSPLSAWLCLGMVTAGAAGDTRSELAGLLAEDGDPDLLTPSAAALLGDYAALEGDTALILTQSVWADQDTQITAAFAGHCQDPFDAPVYTADLDSSAAMQDINAWVKQATGGQIPALLSQPLSPDAAVALLSALSLDAKWASPFAPEDTYPHTFTRQDGTQTEPDFLHQSYSTLPAWSDGETAGALLPYADSDLAFLVVLPGGTASELVENLSGEEILDWMDRAEGQQVRLSLPKFSASWSGDLTGSLKAMGLTLAFDPETADFSAMGAGPNGAPLFLSEVIQKTAIDVAEEGTQAAAVTIAVMGNATAAPPPEEPLVLTLDRPFLYGIVDTARNIPLFLGVYEG
ncbi:serpin family protein [Pseudoflavonifractor phocaeensis]|uniref:serpin family protein n=1 Tax=Pseudoflavonifractor phocaeensis TaxID=1870988 RepID=UPI00195DBB38|nr:serpin family protein [Pseudoflavonifractor phocaeensis]MBM6869716.1 serpin family protein [Pseudoflavonifractor phocaeensis]MBM6939144.1 serpin family protein [Pseudoflavonifractor phocaeensis]